ncbi:MAG: hypothetical protein WCK47_01985 [bacterium]|nr:hypothetical protein [Candidatus Sumerlaeota bacterium]
MLFGPDEIARVKILTAGDEESLEIKINEYLDGNANQTLADIEVEQIEYHGRTGTVDRELIAILVMRVKRASVQTGTEQTDQLKSGI